jgi:hypothetical protein
VLVRDALLGERDQNLADVGRVAGTIDDQAELPGLKGTAATLRRPVPAI